MQRPLPGTRSCFVCGTTNPMGLNLRFETDGTRVTARFRPRREWVGFVDTVHGGLISTVLDEVMVWACGVRTGRFAYCAELAVRFRLPVRPETDLTLVGELAENRRGKLFLAQGELQASDGAVLASATGKYLPVPHEATEALFADFVGDIRSIVRS